MRRILFILAGIFYSLCSYGQNLSVFDADTTDYPVIKAKFFLRDQDGKQVVNLTPADFRVTEKGVNKTVLSVSCPNQEYSDSISSVLTIDISSSMLSGGPRISLAKTAALEWVNSLPAIYSECGLTSFNHLSYLNMDITRKLQDLKNAINALTPSGGTNYNDAFLDPLTGSISVAKKGLNRRVIVFLTDGVPSIPTKTDEIIALANANEISIYCVSLGMPMPASLKQISSQTGGKYFENLTNLQQILNAYSNILMMSLGYFPCEITWLSDDCSLEKRTATISVPSLNLSVDIEYIPSESGMKHLDLLPTKSISFGCVGASSIKDTTITLIARINTINIDGFQSTNPRYSIINWGGTSPPFSIAKDESRVLTLRYTPTDSGYTNTVITILSDACFGKKFSAAAGCLGYGPSEPTLIVTFPNGGEHLIPCSDTTITWEGILPIDTVRLDYSTDNGNTWNLIAAKATNLSYKWRIPYLQSNACLMRAKQIPKNYIEGIDTTITLGMGNLVAIALSPDESKLATLSYTGIIRIYNLATKLLINEWDYQITNSSLSLAGLLAWSPDGSKLALAIKSYFYNSYLRIIDASNGSLISTSTIMPAAHRVMKWNPSSNKICVGYDDYKIRIFDLNCNILHTLVEHTQAITAVAWNNNETHLLSASMDSLALLWNLSNDLPERSIVHSKSVEAADWAPDGNTIATTTIDSLMFWNPVNLMLIRELPSIGSQLKYSNNSNLLMAVNNNGINTSIKVLDVTNNTIIQTFTEHRANILQDIFFKESNRKGVSAGQDSKIRIWDIGSGLTADSLNVYNGKLESLSWNPDGSKIAVSYLNESNINIWDIQSRSITHTLQDQYYLRHLQWSPDGSKLAASSNFNRIRIWDTGNYNLFSSFDMPSASLHQGLWSNNSENYLFIHNDTIRAYNISNSTQYKAIGCGISGTSMAMSPDEKHVILNATNSPVIDMQSNSILYTIANGYKSEWDPAGKVIIKGGFNSISLYDAPTGGLIKEVDFNTWSILDLSVNNYRNLLATCSSDGWISIFDCYQYNIIKVLRAHFLETTCMQWCPDTSKIILATGAPDGFLKIHYLPSLQSTIQCDTSDNFWSISIPKLDGFNVDMGDLLMGMYKDSLITAYITNNNPFPLKIDSISINGINAIDFSIISGFPPSFVLPAGSTQSIEFRFTPSALGQRNAEISIHSNCNSFIQAIQGNGVERQLIVVTEIIDFGKVFIGSQKDTIRVLLKNIGNSTVNITSTDLLGPDKLQFVIDSGGADFTLIPNEERALKVQFQPIRIGRTSCLVGFSYNGVGSPAIAMLFGEGIDTSVVAILQAGSGEGMPGDIVEIPIILKYSSGLQSASVTALDVDLSFNPSLLWPEDYIKTVESNTSAKITLKDLYPYIKIGEPLVKIKCVVALGNAEECDLVLSNPVVKGGEADIILLSGKFRVRGICYEGGRRLINPDNTLAITSIKPNPGDVSITAEFNLIEKGNSVVKIYNEIGRTMYEHNFNGSPGKKELLIDTHDFSNGIYFIRLQTPTINETAKFIILK